MGSEQQQALAVYTHRGTGHPLHVQQPGKVAQAVLALLERMTPALASGEAPSDQPP